MLYKAQIRRYGASKDNVNKWQLGSGKDVSGEALPTGHRFVQDAYSR